MGALKRLQAMGYTEEDLEQSNPYNQWMKEIDMKTDEEPRLIEVAKRYRFDYPAAFTTLPDYSAHRGQEVVVTRALVDGVEYDDEGDPMFRVQAGDGWVGDAWASELEELT